MKKGTVVTIEVIAVVGLAFGLLAIGSRRTMLKAQAQSPSNQNSSVQQEVQFDQKQKIAVSGSFLSVAEKDRINRFARQLENLRRLLKIPGMSVGIVKDQQLIWAEGFGFSDKEKGVAATADTPYEIASITKTFGATLLMQLVEQGKVSLDDPMSKFSSNYKDDRVNVRHVLTHTSEGTPGDRYEYNGNLFDNLTDVVMKASGKRYRVLLSQNILEKLGTSGTSPGNDLDDNPANMSEMLGVHTARDYLGVLKRLAKPYKLYGAEEILLTYDSNHGIGTANGMVSTVTDLARWDIAIDRNLFLKKETQEQMWTSAMSNSGQTLPYGLGWFVQPYQGLKLVWHYGNLPDLYSALLLKIPGKRITLILLANSDALSSPFTLGKGDVVRSAFACLFMRLFVFEDVYEATLPEPNWMLSEKSLAAEIARLEKQGKGYKYDCEVAAQSAMRGWLDERRATARKQVKLDLKVYDAYVGEYQLDSDTIWTIVNERGKLIRQGKAYKMELFPESETEFFSKFPERQYIFVKDSNGRVIYLKVRQGDEERVAKKIK